MRYPHSRLNCWRAFGRASAAVLLFSAIPARAEIRLPRLFSDHLMLQADQPVAIWGWADPGEVVTVTFLSTDVTDRRIAETVTRADRFWSLRLPALAAGKAGRLEIRTAAGEKVEINDVLTGQVWLGGGQSNMAYRFDAPNSTVGLRAIARKDAEAARPKVRFFMTAIQGSDTPLDDVKGVWVVADGTTIDQCSAVAGSFAFALHRELNEPVGLIVSAVNGTPAEAWLPREALESVAVGAGIWKRHHDALAGFSSASMEQHKASDRAWLQKHPTVDQQQKHRGTRPRAPYSPTNNYVPLRFYNGMVCGLGNYTLRGVLWFQADGNNAHPEEYPELIRALILSWRRQWGSELPFYYVEMNNMHVHQTQPVELVPLCLIREAQAAALALPGTGVVSSIDLGTEDAHFPDKKPVGERLARVALAEVYGRPGLVDSPRYAASEFRPDGKVWLTFENAQGLRARGSGAVRGFAIRGADGAWLWAHAECRGDNIVAWHPDIPKPAAVRYAWAANPIISIENAAGLPLRPFRTDTTSPR